MALKYTLLKNQLTKRDDDYNAIMQDLKRYDLESLIQRMLLNGSTITKSDILAVLNSFFELITTISSEGGYVQTDLFSTKLSIKGTFEGSLDHFDPKRHKVCINLLAGRKLKKATSSIKLEKVNPQELRPHIIEVRDSISSSINQYITSGGVIEITGSMLKIEGEHPSNGIYLITTEGASTKITSIIINKPAKLICLIPELEKGEYRLQVITQHTNGKPLKTSRTSTFHNTLTVA
ncbi:MAG: DNA-binding domain-containing protein [Bacteroidales bacterium]